MNKIFYILIYLFFCSVTSKASTNDSTKIIQTKNKIYFSYAPSFGSIDKIFHGIEITYERNIIKLFSISITQGFYATSKYNNVWLETKNNQTNLIPTSEFKYYFNSFATFQLIPYSNKFYEFKIGLGPSLFYKYVIKTKGTDINFPYENKSFDKGVLGGLNFNLENNFFIKKHLMLGFKFQPQLIFPKKNIGDKLVILRPAFNVGYRF